MYGALIAFQDYRPAKGFGAKWVGFKHFERFFKSPNFFILLRNTLSINVQQLIFGFPAPIILALILNEMKNSKFKTLSQTAMYLPHFISTVIICGLIVNFCRSDGLFNDIIEYFGGERNPLLASKTLYQPIYVASGIWQGVGWGTIIYVAALSGIDHELYDAASVDGAGKWKQTLHVTVPGIAPTIVVMLILQVGKILDAGYQDILLLYSELTYSVADVFDTYVYRLGVEEASYGLTSALGLFKSLVGTVMVVGTNKLANLFGENGLW